MPDQSPAVRRHLWMAQVAAYVLIVLLAVVGFWRIGQTQDDLCQSSYDNRAAIRGMSVAIAELGSDLVAGDPGNGPVTAEQQRTLDQFEAFRDQQLDHLTLPTC